MAVQGVSRPSYEAINRVLAEIGKSIDPKTEAGVQVSDGEAQKIIDSLGKMQPADRKLVEAEIIALLKNDVFSTTPEAKQKFAKAFGVEARELDAHEAAALVGLSSSKSAFQMGVETLAKTPQLNRKAMKTLINRADTLLDIPNRQFLAGVLRNASRDGTIKLDSDARKEFRHWMGGLDQQGGVSDWGTNFDTKSNGNVSFLSQLIASGACFEDIVAAFLVHMAGKMQEEQTAKLREIEAIEKREQLADMSAQRNKRQKEFFEENGLAGDGPKPGSTGGKDKPGKTTPTEAPVEAPPPDAEYVKRTKQNLESIVKSVHYHMNDDDKYINADEAGKIAEKLARLEPPVSKLVANALVNSLRRTPGVYLESDTMKPMVEWAKSQLGNDIDLSALPRMNPSDPSDPIASKLRQSDKLEDKLASFIVDTLMSSERELKDKMGDVRQLSEALQSSPEAAAAYAQVAQQPAADGQAPQLKDVEKPGETAEKVLNDILGKPAARGPEEPATATAPTDAAAAATPDAAKPDGLSKADVKKMAQGAASGPQQPNKSRQVLWEELKNLNNELSAVMQALSNILNGMHQNAMNSIRSIR